MKYAVVEVGCTECNTTSFPQVKFVIDDFELASDFARKSAQALGPSGDAFVLRLDDGKIVAFDPDGEWKSWEEDNT